jgi:hypothetical protein
MLPLQKLYPSSGLPITEDCHISFPSVAFSATTVPFAPVGAKITPLS